MLYKYQNSSIQAIQFNISSQFSSIWPLDRTLSGATNTTESDPESDGNEWVLCFPQSSNITKDSASDCLISYPRHPLGVGSLTPLQRCNWCILQPQPKRQLITVCQFFVLQKNTWYYITMCKWFLDMNSCLKYNYFLWFGFMAYQLLKAI